MKNHLFRGLLFASFLTFFTLACVSCTMLDDDIEEGSITLSFPSFARNSVLSSDDENYYLSVKIRGDYTDKELVKITSEVSNCQVVFENIPVGKSIYLTAELYTAYSEAAYLHVFTGKSSNFVVAGGRNQVSIQMTDLTLNDGGGYSTSLPLFELNGEYSSSYGQILFYKNGKYAIEIDSVIYSEGLWSAASVDSDGFPQLEHEGNVIYLTEYIYRNVSGSSNPVIIDEPVTKNVTVQSTSPRGLTNFTSASGAVYLFSET